MSTQIGQSLLEQLIDDLELEGISSILQTTLAVRFGQMYDAGATFFGDNQLAAVLLAVPSTKDALAEKGVDNIIATGSAISQAKENAGILDPGEDPDDPLIQTLDIGTYEDNTVNWEYLDAGQGSFLFTDDASVETFVVITNFSSDDQIQISNLPEGASYVFTPNGNDVDITYNYNDEATMNHIKLIGVGSEADIYDDEAGFEAAIGFNAVTYI